MTNVVTYLMFDGNCREAVTFYAKCLGAELFLMPVSDVPGNPAPEHKDRIMHARLMKKVPVLMASDGEPGKPPRQGNNFSVSIACESAEEVEKLFTALAEGGTVSVAPHDAFWGARFGMLTDRYGISWMFNYEYPKKA